MLLTKAKSHPCAHKLIGSAVAPAGTQHNASTVGGQGECHRFQTLFRGELFYVMCPAMAINSIACFSVAARLTADPTQRSFTHLCCLLLWCRTH